MGESTLSKSKPKGPPMVLGIREHTLVWRASWRKWSMNCGQDLKEGRSGVELGCTRPAWGIMTRSTWFKQSPVERSRERGRQVGNHTFQLLNVDYGASMPHYRQWALLSEEGKVIEDDAGHIFT